jgi:hypothetical protein
MHSTISEPTVGGSVTQPLSPRTFLLTLLVLAACLIAVDLAIHGPLTSCAAEVLLARPAEDKWGFHAEWKNYGTPDDPRWHLTVVRVTSGGAFERAGIEPGFAFVPPIRAGFALPTFGGPYAPFVGKDRTARVRMRKDPTREGPWQVYDLSLQEQ